MALDDEFVVKCTILVNIFSLHCSFSFLFRSFTLENFYLWAAKRVPAAPQHPSQIQWENWRGKTRYMHLVVWDFQQKNEHRITLPPMMRRTSDHYTNVFRESVKVDGKRAAPSAFHCFSSLIFRFVWSELCREISNKRKDVKWLFCSLSRAARGWTVWSTHGGPFDRFWVIPFKCRIPIRSQFPWNMN